MLREELWLRNLMVGRRADSVALRSWACRLRHWAEDLKRRASRWEGEAQELESHAEELDCLLSDLMTKAAELERCAGAVETQLDESSDHMEGKKMKPQAAWACAALHLLERAEAALSTGNSELGWRCLSAARRMEAYGLEDHERQSRAHVILREADEKLGSWRKKAIEDLLGTSADELSQKVKAEDLYYASVILDGHHDNVHRKLRAVRRQLRILTGLAFLAVAAWVVFAPQLMPVAPAEPEQIALGDRGFALALVVFGVMGAAVSSILSLPGAAKGKRIPDLLADLSVMMARPAVAAVCALAAYAFLTSGFLKTNELLATPELALGLAFAAGFSERLVVRAVDAVVPA